MQKKMIFSFIKLSHKYLQINTNKQVSNTVGILSNCEVEIFIRKRYQFEFNPSWHIFRY